MCNFCEIFLLKKECDDNTFGQNCKATCFCLNGTCDKITGVCDIPGCKPGYREKTCSVDSNSKSIPVIVGVLVGSLELRGVQPKPNDALDHVYHELDHYENTEYGVIQTDDNKETTYVNDSFDNIILRKNKIRDEVTEKIKNGTLQEQHKVPNKDSTYIATQGPMKNTVEDFWRMIWQTKSSVIVMLTNVIEKNQVTCFQYWPVSSSVLGIPGYEITLFEEQIRSEFIIRKLKVKDIKTGGVRKVCLLQFTSWPKQSVPHPYQLYLLHKKYAEIIFTNNSGPAIIHCSDGTDRTGVFIAFDAMSQCCYRNETIDICKLVTDMRKYRMNMVATEVLVNNLPQYDDTLYKEAMLKKNRGKNRNNCILPVETYRLILGKSCAGHYINAISVPSCRMSRQFLVTQIPFANTVVDLWNMICEYNSCTVVSLEDAPSFEKNLIWHPLNENKLDLGKLILTKTSESMALPGTKEINLNVLEKGRSKVLRSVLFALIHNVQNQLVNLGLTKSATQSSTHHDASKAVDGSISQLYLDCASTYWDPTPLYAWWQVDLGMIYEIKSIKIYHRIDTSCHQNKYGENCTLDCHCKQKGCFYENGTCFIPGCEAGWHGTSCNKECSANKFGANCTFTCHCHVGSCDRSTGVCNITGCKAGWKGDNCICDKDFFGSNCSSECFCKEGICHPETGKCKNDMCRDGYIGETCSKQCENGTFGYKCASGCHCLIGSCHNVYGTCNLQGCREGWKDLSVNVDKGPKHQMNVEVNEIEYANLEPRTNTNISIKELKTRLLRSSVKEKIEKEYEGVNNRDKSIYVAAQGPKTTTVIDFWRMIWQIKSGIIVMLANPMEKGKNKCFKYWPDVSKVQVHGDLKITLDSEFESLYFTNRQLKVTHQKTGEIRNVHHLHFTTWPDHGTPDPTQLVLFHRNYMKTKSDLLGPPVVHCSAGVGRTGTFIALDALYKHGKINDTVDVFDYVKVMRRNRMSMVQTKEQYIFLHEALLESFEFEETSLSKDEFITIGNQDKRIKAEFKNLVQNIPKYDSKSYKGGMEKHNLLKNRSQNILSELQRSYRFFGHTVSATRYIYDHESSTIVTLDCSLEDEPVPNWIPVNKSSTQIGRFSIRRTYDTTVIGDIKETEDNERIIKVFEVQSWRQGLPTPSSGHVLLKLIEMVEHWKDIASDGPITVVCMDGAKCCGLFCALFNTIQKLRYEDNVDLYQTVKQLQVRRPEFFSSIEQYQFFYNVVLEYIENANIYMN
ncbi:hypothetical protein KUTeg_022965 [Tegillarca granosa]|uniref:protein-tyrosine-phosphatase n=1 Tax=Tegillarca granosa TaxID=220873 RepID=A0ABQ9E5X7_TEGGR|nr:hypothetical protein KUTeg_022965 [Tegillarca granosa]